MAGMHNVERRAIRLHVDSMVFVLSKTTAPKPDAWH